MKIINDKPVFDPKIIIKEIYQSVGDDGPNFASIAIYIEDDDMSVKVGDILISPEDAQRIQTAIAQMRAAEKVAQENYHPF